jgi:hypothetical protein
MTHFLNIITSVALATALMPIAANATTMPPQNHMEIQHAAANAGAATQRATDQTVVQSGSTDQRYSESVGG